MFPCNVDPHRVCLDAQKCLAEGCVRVRSFIGAEDPVGATAYYVQRAMPARELDLDGLPEELFDGTEDAMVLPPETHRAIEGYVRAAVAFYERLEAIVHTVGKVQEGLDETAAKLSPRRKKTRAFLEDASTEIHSSFEPFDVEVYHLSDEASICSQWLNPTSPYHEVTLGEVVGAARRIFHGYYETDFDE